MSLPSYGQYKICGAEWLGRVPAHWRIGRLGSHFNERREKVSDKAFTPLSVTKSGVVPQLETAAKTDNGDNRKRVCVGDFVINSRSDRKGSAGASSIDGSVSLISTVLCPRDRVAIEFAHFLLRSRIFQEEFYRHGKGIVADLWSTNYSDMRNITVALPTLAEQRVIASFLNRETGKIDALIAEQEKLLKLLTEKRRATISKAVTRGLDHNVPTKISGHEFVGSIPSHWCIKPIKAVASINDESLPEDADPDFELSYVDIGSVSLDRGIEGTEVLSFAEAPSRARRMVRHGDVIISTVRTYLKAIAPIVNPPSNLIVSTGFAVIRPHKNLSSAFAKYAMQSAAFIHEIISKSTGVSYPAINASDLARVAVPIPPLDEQIAISAFLDNTTNALDALIAGQNRANILLKERRSALISAAVTGKIDVRDYIAAEEPANDAPPTA